MSELLRPTPNPAASASKARVLVVRQPIRSVRSTDEPDRMGLRLAVGLIIGLGTIGVIWLMGLIGFRLGFAQKILGVRDLVTSPDESLVTGTMMLINIPRVILRAGMADPLLLMVGFVLIAIPAAGLSAAKIPSPGGPRPAQLTLVFSTLGAILAGLNACLLVWWTASTLRQGLIQELPFRPAATRLWLDETEQWLTNLQTVAGLDVLVVVAAALWAVLSMRLAVPLWLRALATSASLFTLVVVATAMSMSNAALTHVETDRAVFFLDDGSIQPRLLLGSTQHHLITLVVQDRTAIVELLAQPDGLEVVGKQSIVDMLAEGAAKP